MIRILLEIVVVLVGVGLLAYAVWQLSAAGRARRRRDGLIYRAHHELAVGGGAREVSVVQAGTGSAELIGSVAVGDPDYEDRLHELMADARQRAAALNSVGEGGR